MKTAFISLTAILVFTSYIALISIAMVLEVVVLSYIFFPAILKKLNLTEIRVSNKMNRN
jgi:hypothetical protein